MYYFYVIQSVGNRVGFGITSNPVERNKQYVSHSGDVVKFRYLYGGIKAHAMALERTIKTQWVDDIWKVEGWSTEWLISTIGLEDFASRISDLIKERHLKLELVAKNFDFTMQLPH
jgi:predicted GIY-YIG superfamily endonuclease